jgi:gliding motility-associated-like protein
MDGYIPLTVNFQNANSAPAHLWTLGDGETSTASSFTHTYKSESVFTVVLMTTSPQGCIEYDSVQIVAFSLFIPNLLTPNGDGFNEKFDLTNLNVNLDLEIYNRWGDLVYKKEGYVNEWPEKDTADGIYYYYIHDAKYKKAFKGWVQILTKTEKSQE